MSTRPTQEQLWGAHVRGPVTVVNSDPTNSARPQFADRTLIASGSVTVTVSTALVGSASGFWLAEEVGDVRSAGGRITVSSIVDGVSFALGRAPATAAAADGYVTWQLINPK